MDVYEKLQKAGLTGNESKAYIELLKKGELSANQLAKNIGMDRTLTYAVLNHLIEKGQVGYVVKENKKIFSCSAPEALLNPIRSKETLVLGLIQELNNVRREKHEAVEVNVYEGKEGFRTFVNLAIKEREILSFGGTGKAYDLLYEMPVIGGRLEKTGTHLKVILGKRYSGHEFTKHKNVHVRLTNMKSESTTTIFGDYVAIHLIKDRPIVVMIKNGDIAESYRNYFKLMWKIAKE